MERLLKTIDDISTHHQVNDDDLQVIIQNIDFYVLEDSEEHLFVLGDLLVGLGHIEYAKEIFLHLFNTSEHDDEVVSYLTDIYITEGNLDEALDVINLSPKTPVTLMIKAEIFQQLNMPEVSLKVLDDAILLSNDPIIQFAKAEIHFYEGNIDEALSKYLRVLDDTDEIKNINIHSRVAEMYMMQSDFDRALLHYDKVPQAKYTNNDLYNKALIYTYTDKHEEAKSLLTTVIDNEPYRMNAYVTLIDIYKMNQDYTKAIEVAKRYIKEDSESALMYHELGVLYYKAHSIDDALGAFESSMEIAPDFGDNYKHVFEILLLSSRTDEIDQYTTHLNIEDTEPDVIYLLAKIHQENESYEEAQQLYEMAYSELNQSPLFLTDYYYFLLETASKTSRHILDQLIALEPENIEWMHEKERLNHEGYDE